MPEGNNKPETGVVKGSYYAKAYYKGDGSTTGFVVPFPYIAKSHVHLYIAGHESSYTWTGDGMIVAYGGAPAAGDIVEVRRVTPRDHRLVTFSDYRALTAAALNSADIQWLYLFQEDLDYLVDIYIGGGGGGSGGGGGGGGSGGGGGTNPPLPGVDIDIDKIREEILKKILEELAKAKQEMKDNLDEAEKRIKEGLDRLKESGKDLFRKAGIVIDEEKGTVTIFALEDLKKATEYQFNTVFERFKAVEASIELGASTVVTNEILTRIRKAEERLDGMNAHIDLKVSETEKALGDKIEQKLTAAELALDGKVGEVTLNVKKLYIDGIIERLTKAELFLNAHGFDAVVFDFKALAGKVIDLSKGLVDNAGAIAEGNDKRREEINKANAKIAYAESKLTAKIEEDGTARSEELKQLFSSTTAQQAAAYDQKLSAVDTKVETNTKKVETLASQYQKNVAAIQEIRNTIANQSGAKAIAGLRLDVNKLVTGYQMSNDGTTGDFKIWADKFYIHSPRGSNVAPFYYNSSNGTLMLNGIKVNWADIVNARITNAMIQNLRVNKAQIDNLIVDTHEIRENAVTRMYAFRSDAFRKFFNEGTYPVASSIYLGSNQKLIIISTFTVALEPWQGDGGYAEINFRSSGNISLAASQGFRASYQGQHREQTKQAGTLVGSATSASGGSVSISVSASSTIATAIGWVDTVLLFCQR